MDNGKKSQDQNFVMQEHEIFLYNKVSISFMEEMGLCSHDNVSHGLR